MASVQSLDIADDTKKYIVEKLNPILIELVQVLIRHSPRDIKRFILNWFHAVKTEGNKDLVLEHAKLLEELTKLQEDNKRISIIAVSSMSNANTTGAASGNAKPADDSEEESDDDMVDELPDNFVQKKTGARGSVSAEAYGAWNVAKTFTPPVHKKSDAERERLNVTLMKSFLFQALEGKDLETVVLAMEEVSAAAGEVMIKQGDDGDFLFIIETGTLECTKPIDGVDTVVKTCVEGDVFGELALLYNQQRAATVKAKDACKLWKLDRESFNQIVKDSAQKKRERYMKFLQTVPLLSSLSEYEVGQVCDSLRSQEVEEGATVVKQGEPGNTFYIIETGTAKAVRDTLTVMEYKDGDFFGELALLRDEPRAATIITTGKASLLTLERRAFTRLLGTMEDLFRRSHSNYN